MRVDQVFALRATGSSPGTERAEGLGNRTRVQLGSALGENLRLRFDGSREDYGEAPDPLGESGPSRAGADAVRLGVAYDPSADSRVTVNAYYSGRDYRPWSSPEASAEDPVRLEGRSWGYDATWNTQLGPESSLEVGVDYIEAELDPLGHGGDGAEAAAFGERVSGRSMAARGSYETLAGSAHRVSVGLRAAFVDRTAAGLETFRDQRLTQPAAGLDVGLEAEDTWHVGGPFSLVCGLDYRHASAEHGASLVVPRVGGSWSADTFLLDMMLSYHHAETWGTPIPEEAPFRPQSRLGYRFAVEVPFGPRFRLDGEARYAPFQEDALGYLEGSVAADDLREPIYFTNGNAAVAHRSVGLIHESAAYRANVEIVSGRVSGTVAALSPYGLQVAPLAEGDLRYHGGRIGVRVADSGTDVALDYRAMQSSPEDGAVGPGVTERSMMRLRVIQDLMRHEALGAWRLIAAVRVDAFDPSRLPDDGSGDTKREHESRQREMSAGLSVLF
jgi:hypothetical protein